MRFFNKDYKPYVEPEDQEIRVIRCFAWWPIKIGSCTIWLEEYYERRQFLAQMVPCTWWTIDKFINL